MSRVKPPGRGCRPSPGPGADSGAVTVEFVLVATVLFVILFSVIELAFVFNAKLLLVGAAREGARRAAVEGGATDGAYAAIQDYLALGTIEPGAVLVTISPRQASYGTTIRVALSYDYPVVTRFLEPILGEEITLTAEVVTRGEKVRGR